MAKIPKSALIPTYKLVFDDPDFYKDRLQLIKNIPPEFIIGEIASINYRLKLPDKLFPNNTMDFQLSMLKAFAREDYMLNILEKGLQKAKLRIREGDIILVFNRAANLYAINELLKHSRLKEYPHGYRPSNEDWFNILKYYLCVNDEIDLSRENPNKKDFDPFEVAAAQMVYTNELAIYENQLLKLDRFVYLMKYMNNNSLCSKYLGGGLATKNRTIS